MKANKVRITKEFRFEMAHALWNYDGLCKHMHGHSYILRVTVLGVPIADKNNPKYGMVMDFGLLKQIVNEEIVNPLDHSVLLCEESDTAGLAQLPQLGDRLIVTPYQPTCENMIIDFADKIAKRLPASVSLHSIRLNETANSFAEWFASDNA